jgi:hypothetical protein
VAAEGHCGTCPDRPICLTLQAADACLELDRAIHTGLLVDELAVTPEFWRLTGLCAAA